MLAWCPLFSDTETLESMCHSSAAVCPWANGKAECDFERRSINKIVNAKICHSSEAAQFLAWLLPAVASHAYVVQNLARHFRLPEILGCTVQNCIINAQAAFKSS